MCLKVFIDKYIYKKEKENHTAKGKKKLDHLRRKFGTTAVNKNEEEVKREYPGLDCYIEDEDPPTEANVEEDILIVELVEEKGMLKLSKPEIAILNMGPDFQLLDAINEEDTEVELAAMGTKIRWQTQCEDRDKVAEEDKVDDPTYEEKAELDRIEAEGRLRYNI